MKSKRLFSGVLAVGAIALAGTFFSPAVVYPVTPDMQLVDEEQFGPVLPVCVYDDEAEIDHFMRRSPYG
ncbi:MAG TPA: aldehyde dehydrogenase family protein, partial [Phycisphaerales bacterium]|nr:aldehyde dehydrogenase family protein [Phycisphaerales bacterium]